jgi:N-acetylglucosamine kinase-like BadF-type ATPase
MKRTLQIIADSGSTKTDWYIGFSPINGRRLASPGLNPFFTQADDLYRTVHELFAADELKEYFAKSEALRLHFYGAGCTPEMVPTVHGALARQFPEAEIEVESDLLGAARALCGRQAGIAGILGTGSNSCQYDGEHLIRQVSPLGFILGDEGSGAVLGRKLVGDVLKAQLPAEICQDFEQTYGLSRAHIINKVYREPNPNRFLASLAPFLSRHRRHPAVRALLVSSFGEYFRRNIHAYDYATLPVHLCGSIAYYFQDELQAAATSEHVRLGRILKAPMEGLQAYHFGEI